MKAKKIFRLISFVLIQAFLMMDCAWCGANELFTTLAPQVNINADSFRAMEPSETGTGFKHIMPFNLAYARLKMVNKIKMAKPGQEDKPASRERRKFIIAGMGVAAAAFGWAVFSRIKDIID